MFNGCDNEIWGRGLDFNPARPTLAACGYDPTCYISTAQLVAYPYTTKAVISARFGGSSDLIGATDDDNTGQINDTILNQIITNATTEINGALTTIYPVPLAKTGTVSVIKVTTVDSSGGVTGISVLTAGNYVVSPAASNSPVYIRYIDPLINAMSCGCFPNCFDSGFSCCYAQKGTGLVLTVAYSAAAPFSVTGTPTIATAGTLYNVNDVLVLVGGSSYVPDKVQNAANILCCYELIRRRTSPMEKNYFALDAKMVKEELIKIGNGEMDLDGTFKRFYSAVSCWGTESVLYGATSL